MNADDVYCIVQDQYYQKWEIDNKLSTLEGKPQYDDTQSRRIIMDDIEKILHGFSCRIRDLIRDQTNVEIPMEDFTDIITWSMEDAFR